MSIADELNEQQRAAVMYNEGHSLIVAGAGSGKTRVLTYKIAYLLHLGLPADRIMALTFTNKAAGEMKKRIASMVGYEEARPLVMGTFHSVFLRFLRIDGRQIGIDPDFTIYDDADSKSLITTIIKDFGLKDEGYKAAEVHSLISKAKNKMVAPADYEKSDPKARLMAERGSKVGDIYREYEHRLAESNALDFDDLLLRTYLLLLKCEDVRERYRRRFAYILVDEFQDTNTLQYNILRLFVSPSNRLCVVGDDAQSIYKFRGAEISNMLDFARSFTGVKVFKLEQNYRSSANIVSAAGSLIAHNRKQIKKNVFSTKTDGAKITVCEVRDDATEAEFLSATMRRLHSGGKPYDEMAVLYRFSGQLRKIEDRLRRDGIPYVVYAGLSFYERAEVKNVLAFLRLIVNRRDNEAFKRVVVLGTGIGDTTRERVRQCARENGVSDFEVASDPEGFGLKANRPAVQKLRSFADFVLRYVEMAEAATAAEIADALTEDLHLRKHCDGYEELSEDDKEKVNNVEELVSAVAEFCSEREEEDEPADLMSYLNNVALLTGQDSDKGGENVKLMTMHSAKGLEFDAVFITGVEGGIFPSERDDDVEEERRLMYVAMTRAREHCIISYAQYRLLYNVPYMKGASVFISEIDPRYVNFTTYGPSRSDDFDFSRSDDSFFSSPSRRYAGRSYGETQESYSKPYARREPVPDAAGKRRMAAGGDKKELKSAVLPMGRIEIGSAVSHDKFGRGKVTELWHDSENGYSARIAFGSGERVMLLKYAKLKIETP